MNALYADAVSRLSRVYPPGEARAVVRVLFDDAFGVGVNDVYADKVRQFSQAELSRLDELVGRLEAGEPVQYVVGRACFGELALGVDRSVLVPRPETFELAQWAAASCGEGARIIDLGTGSGCLAIYLARNVGGARVEAVDISCGALATARANAAACKANVEFRMADMLELEPERRDYNLVVSNPPYVCEDEKAGMHRNVLDYEPPQALFVDNNDPLVFYRAIARFAAEALARQGAVMVEINRRFAAETADVFREAGLGNVEIRRDRYGNDRMIKAVRK